MLMRRLGLCMSEYSTRIYLDPWSTLTEIFGGRYHTVMEDGGELATKRRNQSKLWLWTHVTDRLTSRFKESAHVRDQIDSIQHKVETGKLTAGQGADFLLSAAFDEH